MEGLMHQEIQRRPVITIEAIAAEIRKPHRSLDLVNNGRPPDLVKFATSFSDYLRNDNNIPTDQKEFSWATVVRTWSHIRARTDLEFNDSEWRGKFAAIVMNSYIAKDLPEQFKNLSVDYFNDRKAVSSVDYWQTEENLKLYESRIDKVWESIKDINEFIYGVRDLQQANSAEEIERYKAAKNHEAAILDLPEGKFISEARDSYANALGPIKLTAQSAQMRFDKLKPKE